MAQLTPAPEMRRYEPATTKSAGTRREHLLYFRESGGPRDEPPAALKDGVARGELGVKRRAMASTPTLTRMCPRRLLAGPIGHGNKLDVNIAAEGQSLWTIRCLPKSCGTGR